MITFVNILGGILIIAAIIAAIILLMSIYKSLDDE